jgi:alanyl-tRNA synthetase
MEVDWWRRQATSKNHTAAHILQRALKVVLGDHVAQNGSLVTWQKLRFDFMHNGQIEPSQLQQVEKIAQNTIDEVLDIKTEIMSLETARNTGATALFGEKYPDNVRVVTIGDDFSKELCGGEHVANTGQIGAIKIISHSSVGSGIRRIEAITGSGVIAYFDEEIKSAQSKIDAQMMTIRKLEKQIAELKSTNFVKNIQVDSVAVGSATLLSALANDADQKAIFRLIDNEKKADDERIFLIGNVNSESGLMAISLFVSNKLVEKKIDGRDALTFAIDALGSQSKAGGRADFAQTGGLVATKFGDCIDAVKRYVATKI